LSEEGSFVFATKSSRTSNRLKTEMFSFAGDQVFPGDGGIELIGYSFQDRFHVNADDCMKRPH
jgi:hypothetical protein